MNDMADKLLIRLSPELKRLIDDEAKRLKLRGGMGELAVRILAENLGRPDLTEVPHKRMGRPPKIRRHVNGTNGNGKPSRAAVAAVV